MGLEKAKLITEKNKTITVCFNPAEYSIQKAASYSEKAIIGMDGKLAQFISGENETLTMTLYFDTYQPPVLDESGKKKPEGGTNVTGMTNEIRDLAQMDGSLHRPPIVTFSWGKVILEGVITNVNQTFTMFLPSGIPVRAKMDITLKKIFQPGASKKKVPHESPDRTKFRTVKEGEQLWNYAYEEYGDVGMWKVIARENQIADPLRILPGQMIRLPAITGRP